MAVDVLVSVAMCKCHSSPVKDQPVDLHMKENGVLFSYLISHVLRIFFGTRKENSTSMVIFC